MSIVKASEAGYETDFFEQFKEELIQCFDTRIPT